MEITDEILAGMPSAEVGAFFASLTPADYKAFCRQEKIPWVPATIVLPLLASRHRRRVQRPFDAAVARARALGAAAPAE